VSVDTDFQQLAMLCQRAVLAYVEVITEGTEANGLCVTQNFLKLSSKPIEGFLKSFRRFRENLWHLSDDTTKIKP